ncbi:MAG TPA: hypothetical protein PKM21_08785 [Anaerolineales bacterium]|nr:hypothetical protein [Anaerolineales bacterium]
MWRSRHFLLVVGTLVLLAMACQAVVPPEESSAPASTSQPSVLFQDDFSDVNSGWDRYEDTDALNDYYNDGYRILVNKPSWWFWSNPGLNFSDVIIDVDATKIGGPDENDMGIICRYKDDANFYFFTISSDGYYGVSKFVNGEEFLIGMESLGFNDTIVKIGGTTNHMQARCVGSSLTLTVNGQVLADVNDSEFTSGDVGLIVGAYDATGVDILFDNFVVAKP